jgi:predicted RNase H-like nuclease (RuvC/YqgF family)
MDKKIETMDKKIETMDKKIETMDKKIETMDKKLDEKADKKDIVRLETKLYNDTKALHDGYVQTYEKLTVVEQKVDEIALKVEKQDIEIKVIKGGKIVKAK